MIRMSTRIAGTAALAAIVLAGCGGTPEAQPTPMPGALAVAQTSGARSTTVTLSRAIDGHLVNATCTGKGHLRFRTVITKADGTTSDGGSGDIACPGVVNTPGITLPAGAKVTVEVTKADQGVTGIVQLASPQS